jgi:hypothetical protein
LASSVLGHGDRRGVDQAPESRRLLDPVEQRGDEVDVAGARRLGDRDLVDLVAGHLDDVDEVAVAVVPVESVDSQRDRAARPVLLLQRVDDVDPGLRLSSGATASSRSSMAMSAPAAGAFSSMRRFEPGTASSLRCRRGAIGTMRARRRSASRRRQIPLVKRP